MTSIKPVNENLFDNIFTQTVEDMKRLGTYRQEFSPAITTYAEMRVQYQILMEQFYSTGCKVAEEYTNKAGATNIRKTALYLAIETLRKDIAGYENVLGLTPAGLEKIRKGSMKEKKSSKLAEALSNLGN